MRIGARTGAGREAAAVEVLIGVRRDPKCYAKATTTPRLPEPTRRFDPELPVPVPVSVCPTCECALARCDSAIMGYHEEAL